MFSPVDAVDQNGNTALIYASKNGNINVVRRLIELNANVDYQEPFTQCSALHYAAQCGHTRTAEVLIKIGNAKKDIRNYMGKTPYNLAQECGHGNNKVMKRLFECDSFSDASTDLSSVCSSNDTEPDLNNNYSGSSLTDVYRKDMNNNLNNNRTVNNKNNKNQLKKSISFLPNPMLLERMAQCGCFWTMKNSYGFSLLAKNNSDVKVMIAEAFENLSIPFGDLTTLQYELHRVIDDLNFNVKFARKDYEQLDPDNLDSQKIANLIAYYKWLKDNEEKVKKMIDYINCHFNELKIFLAMFQNQSATVSSMVVQCAYHSGF